VSAAAIVYHNALSASFFDDDFQWLVGSWSFHPSQLVAFGTLSHFYRPVIDLYFAAATPLFHGSPVLFHLASIVLHAANALVIFALARTIARSNLFGFLTALFFVVQPSDIDAIAWVGALAEAVGAFFGCLSLLFFLLEGGSSLVRRSSESEGGRTRRSGDGRPRWRELSVLAFLLALLTHESSVVFLPILALADWAFVRRGHPPSLSELPTSRWVLTYAPYVVLTLMYLAVDLVVNSRNYVVSQGHYTIGLHVVQNALDYIDALYVGRRDALNYAVIAVGVALLLVRGSRRVKFATVWMLLALAPFLFFNWANTSRYLYQPAIGFSMLLAEAVMYLDRVMRPKVPSPARAAILTMLVAGIAVRFALFAMGNVKDFADRTQVYPEYLARFREIHGEVASHAIVPPDPRLDVKLPYQFVNAAVQWEYRDPTIQVTPYD
jgi:hypothetical protein